MLKIFLLIYIRKYNEKIKINKLATLISLIVIIANMSIFAYIKYREIKTFNEITEDIKIMKNTKNLNLKLGGFPDLYGYFYTLNDNGVKYTIKNNIKEENMKFKYSWRIVVEEK